MYNRDYYISDDVGDKLPFKLAINSGVYGYRRNDNNTFVAFKSQADVDAAYQSGVDSGKQNLTNLLNHIRTLSKLPLTRTEACPGQGMSPTGYYPYVAGSPPVTYYTGNCPVCGYNHTAGKDWKHYGSNPGMPAHSRTVTYDYAYTVTESILEQYS